MFYGVWIIRLVLSANVKVKTNGENVLLQWFTIMSEFPYGLSKILYEVAELLKTFREFPEMAL